MLDKLAHTHTHEDEPACDLLNDSCLLYFFLFVAVVVVVFIFFIVKFKSYMQTVDVDRINYSNGSTKIT